MMRPDTPGRIFLWWGFLGWEAQEVTPLQTLKALVSLQEIDVRIRELEKDREQIPSRLTEIETILGGKDSELAGERNQLDEAEMSRRMLEGDLKAEKEKIKKWEARLTEIRSNRDYQALSREIEAARKANLGIEDEILKKMQEIEDLKASISLKEQDMAGLNDGLSSERDELEEKLRSINDKISGEDQLRTRAKQAVEDRWLRQYETIRKRRDGVAVVAVLDEHCQGCHMGIPPQLYNIVLKGERIETCPYCHRIVYYKQSLDTLGEDFLQNDNG
jgi:predicted  nucleic acid-binding Zn-ribbon protein